MDGDVALPLQILHIAEEMQWYRTWGRLWRIITRAVFVICLKLMAGGPYRSAHECDVGITPAWTAVSPRPAEYYRQINGQTKSAMYIGIVTVCS
jgi:hypothetical protein